MPETTTETKFSLQDQLTCVHREIGMRERVYPKFVMSGKMKQEAADREIACMKAVHMTLLALFAKCT
jgi:hypothetical protein